MSRLLIACASVSVLVVAGCGSGMRGEMAMPGSAIEPEPAKGSEADPIWELARPGQPTLTIELRGDVLVLGREHDGARLVETLARGDASAPFEGRASTGITADVEAPSCVEVVSVESDALVVKVGVVMNGTCVLSDELLRFAKQAQR